MFLVVFVRGGYTSSIHLSYTIALAARTGAPLPSVSVPASQVFLWVGVIAVALGIWADIGALCLLLFLIPATYWGHAFWRFEGEARQAQLGSSCATSPTSAAYCSSCTPRLQGPCLLR